VLAAFLRCHRHVTRCAAKGQCPSASNIIIVIADGQGCLIRLVSRERKKAPVGLAAASGSFFFAGGEWARDFQHSGNEKKPCRVEY
jgi:hypothetical protein